MNRILAGILVLACVAVYLPALDAPFVFDDLTAIQENQSIRRLWPLSAPLSPPRGTGETVEARPLLNLSFALNYAAGGLDVRGYHAVNLGLHAIAALLLFAISGRTLQLPAVRARMGDGASTLAFAIALVWALHPLQTAAVTYTSRRADVLAGLFVLLALWSFVRAAQSEGRRKWWIASAVASCWLGVVSKEAAVVAPVLLFLYDRTFLAGSFRRAWNDRWSTHLALASSWLLLGLLLGSGGNRGGTAGFGTTVPMFHYALTQADAVTRYLGLAVWPHPLVFDYGTTLHRAIAEVWPQLLFIGALLTLTVVLLRRAPFVGFPGAWLFITLAPASSVVPVATQTIAEHRMYLPLAALAALFALVLHHFAARRGVAVLLCAAVALGVVSFRRNLDYRSELSLWADTVAKRPDNARAHNALGRALSRDGRPDEALAAFRRAVALAPESSEAQSNLGGALVAAGRGAEAIEQLREAVRLAPASFAPRANLASALQQAGNHAEAIEHFEVAARLDPRAVDVRYRLAQLLSRSARLPDAVAHYQAVIELDPGHVGARNNLGNTLLLLRRPADAIPHYQAALEIAPSAPTHANLATAFLLTGRVEEARAHYEAALALDPDYRPAREGLARISRR